MVPMTGRAGSILEVRHPRLDHREAERPLSKCQDLVSVQDIGYRHAHITMGGRGVAKMSLEVGYHELQYLIERARTVVMTAEQEAAQRRSFAYGNAAFENPRITKKMIEEAAYRLEEK